jgi:phage shock protein PspC (stress-responsive transcriptional regulator)
MSLFGLVLVLVLLGVALWALGQFPAIDPTIVKIIRVVIIVVAVFVALFFLYALFAHFGLADFRMPRMR